MQWSNLYSTESKYKLEFSQSKLQQGICRVEILLLSFSYISLVYLWFDLLTAALFLMLVKYIYERLSRLFMQCQRFKSAELSLSGLLQTDAETQWQIAKQSKINGLGCLLVLYKRKMHSAELFEPKEVSRQFIFSDSLTPKSYSRLCRVVLKVQQQPANHVALSRS